MSFSMEDIEIFWGYLDISENSKCWIWRGALNNNGVGIFYYKEKGKRKGISARKFIIDEIYKLNYDHKIYSLCGNDSCCNPEHLSKMPRTYSQEINDEFIKNFWDKVDIRGKDDCWFWKNSLNSDGYGIVRLGDMQIASRVAYMIENGIISPKARVRHTCDNRNCCNPKHLIAGPQKENILDMEEKGRSKHSGWEKKKFDEHEIIDIRNMWANKIMAKDIATKYNVTPDTIYKIRMGKTYKKWGGPIDPINYHGGANE